MVKLASKIKNKRKDNNILKIINFDPNGNIKISDFKKLPNLLSLEIYKNWAIYDIKNQSITK